MKAKDAYMFPIIGSCVLFGLYILFKLFSKDYINLLLLAYFLCFGVMAVSATLRPLVALCFPRSTREGKPHTFTLFSTSFEWTVIDACAFALGLAIGVWYFLTKHWIANNVLGLAFSIQGIALLSLGSYQIGCILLVRAHRQMRPSHFFIFFIFFIFPLNVRFPFHFSFLCRFLLVFH